MERMFDSVMIYQQQDGKSKGGEEARSIANKDITLYIIGSVFLP
jgi:hypothetical protein